ncbi:glycosyltransferase family 9 protein [Glaciimonas sp. CA11.2]|uniref:glycosyltransferase family 9 protein n=2 Tax=unclassified Glaciimonas TaxID=2644401 RepID=UPI002B224DEB|nr:MULTISPECIES: glycosyltransferase family 9 protein [unclassified Glaciimonas]MEB0012386.1 glycosyltransferase family 9 protein [Glaciimonas sp. Cout2]MEB0080422.1 glycosyltransferase family 9 protein [Glaciimonas sp. Gout2]MEB0163006.1 glycosyltransferase family 9 protein [Glaciimonas sp. CA11.2]
MAITSAHILICRTDNIGDVMLTLPIAARLKQQHPSIKISFLCRAYAAPVVRHCRSVDEVVELEDFLSDPSGYFARAGIDTVIIAQPVKQLAQLAFKARIKNRIGNARQKLYQLLYCNRRVRFKKGNSEHHEAQFNFEFLRPFGLKTIPEIAEIAALYDFDIPENEEVNGLLAQHPFNLIIHTKSNGHGREWPIAHYVTLAKQLSAYKDIQLWLTGSATEGQWLAENAGELLRLPNVSNVCGRFTLDVFTSFIKAADGLIASGTGPLHISAAIGQRTLGLFPPIRPMHPGRWAPVGTHAQSLCIPTNCAGCKDIDAAECACMLKISPGAVAKIVLEWHKEAIPVTA